MTIPFFTRYEYRNQRYIVRDIELNHHVCRLGPEALRQQIQLYNDLEGKQIDETIFFYVPDEMITAGKTALELYVLAQLK